MKQPKTYRWISLIWAVSVLAMTVLVSIPRKTFAADGDDEVMEASATMEGTRDAPSPRAAANGMLTFDSDELDADSDADDNDITVLSDMLADDVSDPDRSDDILVNKLRIYTSEKDLYLYNGSTGTVLADPKQLNVSETIYFELDWVVNGVYEENHYNNRVGNFSGGDYFVIPIMRINDFTKGEDEWRSLWTNNMEIWFRDNYGSDMVATAKFMTDSTGAELLFRVDFNESVEDWKVLRGSASGGCILELKKGDRREIIFYEDDKDYFEVDLFYDSEAEGERGNSNVYFIKTDADLHGIEDGEISAETYTRLMGGLPGATFKVYNEDGKGYEFIDEGNGKYRQPYKSESSSSEIRTVTEVTTNTSGRLTLTFNGSEVAKWVNKERIPVKFYLREIDPPEGYSNVIDELEFIVGTASNPLYYNVSNTRDGSLIIVKHDADDDTIKLEGALFKLYEYDSDAEDDLGDVVYFEEDHSFYQYVGTTYSAGTTDELFTNDSGIIHLRGIREGKYILVEHTPPTGYIIGDTDRYSITIDKGEHRRIELPIANAPTQPNGSITIQKHAEGDESKTLSGAVFSLYEYDASAESKRGNLIYFTETRIVGTYEYIGTEKSDDDNYKHELSTNRNGLLKLLEVPNGRYVLHEVKAPDGYMLLEDDIEILIESNDQHITRHVENVPKPKGSITITKFEKDSTKTLSGAVFNLYKYDNDERGERPLNFELQTGKAGYYDYIGTSGGATRLETNSDGVLSLEGLDYGKYLLVEIQTPTGYAIIEDKNNYVIVIDDEHKAVKQDVENVPDDSDKGSITVKKYYKDGSVERPLEGAFFSLYPSGSDGALYFSAEGTAGTYKYVGTSRSSDSDTTELETNSSGQLSLEGIPYGDYVLVEEKAPDGYKVNGTGRYSITVNGTNKTIERKVENVPLDEDKGTITVKKFYTNGSDKVSLAGAVFSLYPSGSSEALYFAPTETAGYYTYVGTKRSSTKDTKELETNRNGRLYLEDIPFGSYVLVEENAPNGYRIGSTSRYNITVNSNNQSITREVENFPTSSSSSPSSTPSGSSSTPGGNSSSSSRNRSSSSDRDRYNSRSSRPSRNSSASERSSSASRRYYGNSQPLPPDNEIIIEDGSTPLGNTPGGSPSSPTTINDGDVPLVNLPRTGLSGPRISAILVFMAASAGTIVLLKRDKKKRK